MAWVENGYIEFMTSAFDVDPDHMHRLLLHEKSHFIYGSLMSDKLKEEWADVGEWYSLRYVCRSLALSLSQYGLIIVQWECRITCLVQLPMYPLVLCSTVPIPDHDNMIIF